MFIQLLHKCLVRAPIFLVYLREDLSRISNFNSYCNIVLYAIFSLTIWALLIAIYNAELMIKLIRVLHWQLTI